jgi:predicted nucleotidyltransferase
MTGDWVPPAAAAAIIDAVTTAIAATTGSALVGLYLYGSLATGDFDERMSDIDLLVFLSTEVSPDLAAHLERMHREFADDNPTWRGRIEVIYVSVGDLASLRERPARIHVITVGEPFAVVSAGTEWVITWYPARHSGIALIGPPVTEFVPDFSFEEYAAAVRSYMRRFNERVTDNATPGAQAYAVLTMCRGLYTWLHSELVSKLKAAEWAQRALPEWAELIEAAISWREHQWEVPQADGRATVLIVRRFVAEIDDRAKRSL